MKTNKFFSTKIKDLKLKINFPISRFVVRGNSMFPTLKPGQTVITFNWFINTKPGDIVVAWVKERLVIKRVGQIKKGSLFLTGDNLKESTDSRNWGEVLGKDLKGKVVLVL